MKNFWLVSALVLCLPGCASITNSKMQAVSVTAQREGDEVENAKCTLMNDKGSWYTTTPGSLTIQKSYGDMTVTCKKKGMPSGIASVASHSNGGVWGNVIAGGLIGYAVDSSTGAGFDYPTNINVEMGKTTMVTPPPQQTPVKNQGYNQ